RRRGGRGRRHPAGPARGGLGPVARHRAPGRRAPGLSTAHAHDPEPWWLLRSLRSMRRRRRTSSGWTTVVAAGVLVPVAACGGVTVPTPTPLGSEVERLRVEPAEAGALPDLVAAADALGLELVAAGGDGTTVTSPASLQLVLSMAAEGAQGQ